VGTAFISVSNISPKRFVVPPALTALARRSRGTTGRTGGAFPPDAETSSCRDAQMLRCPDAEISTCPDVQTLRCSDVQMSRRSGCRNYSLSRLSLPHTARCLSKEFRRGSSTRIGQFDRSMCAVDIRSPSAAASLPGSWCSVLGARCLVLDARCLAHGAGPCGLVLGAWCLLPIARRPRSCSCSAAGGECGDLLVGGGSWTLIGEPMARSLSGDRHALAMSGEDGDSGGSLTLPAEFEAGEALGCPSPSPSCPRSRPLLLRLLVLVQG
jgi:hypothetical protein